MTELGHTIQSKKTLLKASGFAALLAIIIFFIAILPAEFGIDPTGLGKAMRLTQLTGQTQSTQAAIPKQALPYREDSVNIGIPAGRGLEYKFYLASDAAMQYSWSTKEDKLLFFDFHGEPQGDTTGYFESYTVSTASNVRGSFKAPFEGSHGWYWKNKGKTNIVVTLKTKGNYKIIGIR